MTSDHGGGSITSVLQETRIFPSFQRIRDARPISAAWHSTRPSGSRAKDDPEGFWGEHARVLAWDKTWDKVLDWQPPFAKWFVGGTTQRLV